MLFPAAVVALSVLLVWVYRDQLRELAAFARDRDAVTAYLDQIGIIGPLVFGGLIGVQVLIPSLPAEPPMVAGAYAYGFLTGFLISWGVMVAVTQLVFLLARWAGRPLVVWFVPEPVLQKWTRTAGEKGLVFFLLAFIIPPVPSDIMVYVAGLSAIDSRKFFIANLVGRAPLVALYSLVGANGFQITGEFLLWLSVIGLIMLAAWWYYIVRERPQKVVEG